MILLPNKKFFYTVLILLLVFVALFVLQIQMSDKEGVIDFESLTLEDADVVVNIGEMYFRVADSELPDNEIRASVGDIIAFYNEGAVPHTATIPFYDFDEVLAPGDIVFMQVTESVENTLVDCLFHFGHEARLTVVEDEMSLYNMSQVAEHDSRDSCWVVINSSVYNLTDFMNRHPGGVDAILQRCGADGTEVFENRHGTPHHEGVLDEYKIGELLNSY